MICSFDLATRPVKTVLLFPSIYVLSKKLQANNELEQMNH